MNERKRSKVGSDVDVLLKEQGLLESVEEFLTSENVESMIVTANQDLLESIKKLTQKAPIGKVQAYAIGLLKEFENNNPETLRKDVFLSFKYTMAVQMERLFNLIGGKDLQGVVVSSVRENIPKNGNDNIIHICRELVNKNIEFFVREIYSGYVPEGIPEDVIPFLQLYAGGPVVPFSALVPGFCDDGNGVNRKKAGV